MHTQSSVAIFDLGETLIALPKGLDEEARIAELYGVSDEYVDFVSQQVCLSKPMLSTVQYVDAMTSHLKERTGLDRAPEARRAVELSIEESILQPDTVSALSALIERGISRCLISNTNPVSRNRLRHHKIDKMFDFVILSCDVGYSKPDPRIFELAFNHFQRPADEFCAIGDKVRTIVLGVAHLGTKTVLVERRSKKPVISSRLPVDAMVPDLDALCQLPWLQGKANA